MDCYRTADLRLACDGACRLTTAKGKAVAAEGDSYAAVFKQGVILRDTVFRCYGGDCGFDVVLDENRTYSSKLPEEINS
jgi:hypothetical protein